MHRDPALSSLAGTALPDQPTTPLSRPPGGSAERPSAGPTRQRWWDRRGGIATTSIGPAIPPAGETTHPAMATRLFAPDPRRSSPASIVAAVVGACVVGVIAWSMIAVASSFGPEAAAPRIIDFHITYIVGTLALKGHVLDAYAWATLQPLEAAFGRGIFSAVPFSYPPPVALLLAPLALLPIGLAYAVFVVTGFALLAVVLFRLNATWFWPLILALSPAIAVNVVIGQSGMFAAGLAGLSALLVVERRDGAAGVMAGLLATLKPQICTTLPVLFVLRRRWRAGLAATATVAALFAVTMPLLGPGLMQAFLNAMAESSQALADGRIGLHRVTSVYGTARSFGASAGTAMLVHVAMAILVLGGTAVIAARLADRRTELGLALMATAFVSPYFHDYDLAIMGVGLALVLPAMVSRGASRAVAFALVALAVAESLGPFEALAVATRVSIGAPIVLACMLSTLVGLHTPVNRRLRDETRRAGGGSGSELGARRPEPQSTAL